MKLGEAMPFQTEAAEAAEAKVWQVWFLGLVTGAAETAALMVLARVAACIWGENYWLMGTSAACGMYFEDPRRPIFG